MIEFARMSIEINKRNYDRKMKAQALREEREKFEAEIRMLKEAAKSKKKKSSNKGDEDDSEGEEMAMMRQQMLEEQAPRIA